MAKSLPAIKQPLNDVARAKPPPEKNQPPMQSRSHDAEATALDPSAHDLLRPAIDSIRYALDQPQRVQPMREDKQPAM